MPSKIQNIFVCSNCDAQSLKWSGRCLECGAWGSLQAQVIDRKEEEVLKSAPAEIFNLDKIQGKEFSRIKTGIFEADRVFGGGIVPGSLILLAGEPGVGKSTMVAQIADAIGSSGAGKILYLSGEESASQVKDRFSRLKCDLKNIGFMSETNADKAVITLEKEKPALAIIDSIQSIYTSESVGEPGNLNQIRASASKFLEVAKKCDIAIILIGHITKDGQIAGPKILEHIVDAVIYLESETAGNYRILRAIKNRFGSINELGVFEMAAEGFKEVPNPSGVFFDINRPGISGAVSSCVVEGSRPFLVEIQALVTKTVFGYPQRKSSGFDLNRLQVLAAVLTKRAEINLNNQDIILNIAGGLRVADPALDLGVCAAIISSLSNQSISPLNLILGEVGLGGEIRTVNKIEQRIAAAEKLGFKKIIAPANLKIKSSIKIIEIGSVRELIKLLPDLI